MAAFTVSSLLIEAENPGSMLPNYFLPWADRPNGKAGYPPEQIRLYSASWSEADKATKRRANIDAYLARPKWAGGGYGLTPASTRKVG